MVSGQEYFPFVIEKQGTGVGHSYSHAAAGKAVTSHRTPDGTRETLPAATEVFTTEMDAFTSGMDRLHGATDAPPG